MKKYLFPCFLFWAVFGIGAHQPKSLAGNVSYRELRVRAEGPYSGTAFTIRSFGIKGFVIDGYDFERSLSERAEPSDEILLPSVMTAIVIRPGPTFVQSPSFLSVKIEDNYWEERSPHKLAFSSIITGNRISRGMGDKNMILFRVKAHVTIEEQSVGIVIDELLGESSGFKYVEKWVTEEDGRLIKYEIRNPRPERKSFKPKYQADDPELEELWSKIFVQLANNKANIISFGDLPRHISKNPFFLKDEIAIKAWLGY